MSTLGKFFAGAVLSVVAVFARAESVTWTLPADWEADVSYTVVEGRLQIRGGELRGPAEPGGAPELPYLVAQLPVAMDATMNDCSIDVAWTPVVTPPTSAALRPMIIQTPHVIGESSIATEEDSQYFGASAYPSVAAEAEVQTFSGEGAILLKVTPYRWNGVAGTLEKASALTVTCDYTAPRKRATLMAAGEKIDMVIISPPAFTNLWPAYVEYRKTTHPDLNIIIKNTAEIYNEYTGVDDAQRIHKYLEDLYANNQLKYAILGAGCAKSSYNRQKEIPIRNNVAAGSMYYTSDLYYSCMEKKGGQEVWDYGGDGVFLGYKKSGGGYACDTAAQVDWTPEIACFRFPLRETVFLRGIASKVYREYSAEQQMNGLIAKLRRVESADGNFTGSFKAGFSGKKTFSAWQRGRTDDKVAGEHTFFDWDTNPWSSSHTANVDDWEYYTRHNIYNYVTPYRPLTQVWCGSSDKGTGANIYNNDLEYNAHASHGQKQTAQPFEAFNFFTNTKIQKILNFSFSCQTGHLDMENYDAEGNICFAEACILNPNGGALATFNNTREGWGTDRDYYEMLSLLVHVSMSEAFFSLSDGSAGDAFIKGHNRVLNRNGGINPGSTMAGCYVETIAMGDPLVRLADYPQNETFAGSVNGRCVKNATMSETTSVDGNSGVEYLTVAPTTAGDTVTVNGGYTLKVFNKLTVNNGNLQWDAAGGVGRNGIEFTGTRGDLTFTGSKVRYFGPRFTNVGNIRVNGSGVTLDFDKTGSVRDFTSLSFTGGGSSSNAIRSREGGIFKDTLTIPVTDGTLWLNTINVGGVADKRSAAPLFALTNSTLKICENPHWGTEFLSRGVTMNGSTINVNYQSVGFGPAVNGAGFNLDVLAGTNYINGGYDAEISGQFKTDVADGATLIVQTPLTKSGRTGSLLKTGAGTLELRASNAFQGGLTVRAGTVIAGSQSQSALAAGEVVVENGATLKLEAIPATSITRLTVKAGGKLILPGEETTASYLLVDPLKASLNFEDGAEVYNENDLTTQLVGNTTSDGYYMNTSAFLNWGGADGSWTNEASVTSWTDNEGVPAGFTDGRSVQFLDSTARELRISVGGTVNPGYANFVNHVTTYAFTKADASATINLDSLYTVGETIFEPAVKASSKTVVTAGKATFGDLTTGSVTVAPEGELQVTGNLTPVTMINKIVFNATSFRGDTSKAFLGIAKVWFGYQLNELEFYCDGQKLTLPVGTVITASGTFNGTTTTQSVTITGVDADGNITSTDGTASVKNLVDGLAGTGWGCANPGSSQLIQSNPTMTVTIQLGAPIRMFTSYRIAGGDTNDRSPDAWKVTVTENLSGSSTVVSTVSANSAANNWWTSGAIAYNGASNASLSVAEGGTLYLDGTLGAAVTLTDGARLAVTNASCMTVSKGLTLGSAVTLDVSEAAKMGWTKVLEGANLSAADVYKFELSDADAAAKVEGGDLYVATENVIPGPYTRTISGAVTWNSAGWKANGQDMTDLWADSVTLPTGDAVLDVSGNATLDVDTLVSLGTITVTNSAGGASTLTVTGSRALTASVLDFSGYNGKVVWNPDLAGASVICGTNDVTLANGNGATLSVDAGGIARIAGMFATYANDVESRVDFIGTGRALTTSQIPSKGTLSFTGATLTGGYQNTAITYLVEDGDALVMNAAADNMAARNTGSFDIRGGSVTVNPNAAAWWFGDNGHSRFTMSGGTFTCNATGTGITGSGNGLLIGYTTDGAFSIDLDISGGVLAVPNSSLNFYNPATMTVSGEGRVRAKGVFAGASNVGNITVEEGGMFELGSIGLAPRAVNFNLYGGTLAGFENGAKLNGAIELGGAGTLAAVDDTTLNVNAAVTGEGTLTIGAADYTGTVKFSTLPEAETIVVDAGTLHLGALRPLEKTLGASAGAVAITLSNAQISEAQTAPVQIMKATEVPAGGVKVYSVRGHEQSETVAEIVDGFLTVRTTHDNTVETVSNAKWGNAGDASSGGIVTGINQGNYSSFTANFGVANNMTFAEIGGEGTVNVKQIRFAIRDSAGTAPTGLKLTQGETVINSSSVATTTDKSFVCYLSGYLSDSGQRYSWNSYTFTFTDEAVLDASEDFTLEFTGVETAGIRVVTPVNSKLQISGGSYSPMIEIIGDYSYPTGEGSSEAGGDSISINVIGGNKNNATGKSIASGKAGAYPIAAANWNQKESRTDNNAFENTYSGLKEVRADGTITETSPMSVTLKGACTYIANGTTPSGADAELAYGYIDDGGTGAKFVVDGIPYSQYDVYVYMGSDQSTTNDSFGPVSVASGSFTTNYPSAGTAWGVATATQGEVTLEEGVNYFRVTGLTGSTLTINGSVNGTPAGTRCGLAGIQVVNTGIRYDAYTWNGGAEAGVWSTSAANWLSPEGAEVAWPSAGEGNVAKFTGSAAVEVSGAVNVTQISIATGSPEVSSVAYVPETDAVLFPKTQLACVSGFAANMAGNYISSPGAASPYFYSNDGATASVQFQKIDDGYLKCVKLVMSQSGDDIVGHYEYVRYIKDGSLGTTCESGAQNQNSKVDGIPVYHLKDLTANVRRLTLTGEGTIASEVTLLAGHYTVPEGMLTDYVLGEGAFLTEVGDEPAPDPSTAAKLEINFFTPENNKIGVEYILGETVWTNVADAVSGENYWRNAAATALNGADGVNTLVYKTPDNAAQTLLAGGKGFNPNANLNTSAQYWQVAIPLNLPEGVTYTFKSVLPEIMTLTAANGLQVEANYLQYSAEVTVVKGSVTNTTGRIGPSSYITGTLVNTVTGAMAQALTLSGENTLLLKMWHNDGDSSKSGVYTAALGIELYRAEEDDPEEDPWLITERSETAFDVSTGREGTSEKTLVFALPEDAVQEITGSSTDANRGYGLKVTSGILNFTQTGGATSFAGRLVTAEGSNAVIRLAYGDATGWSTAGTGIVLADGGLLKIAVRDTLKAPITLDNGSILLESGVANGSGRALDLYAGAAGNNWTVSGNSSLTAQGTDADRKVLIRDGAWDIDVAESGKMVLDVDVITSGVDASGSRGALVKKGAGVLELRGLPLGCAFTIDAGTVNLVATITDGFTICSGDLVGASEENIYVNGTKLADTDWTLSGNQLVARGVFYTDPSGVKHNITAAFEKDTDGVWQLKEGGAVTITIGEMTETIAVVPVIDAEHEETEIAEGAVVVKTIPGLSYKLIRGVVLGVWETEPAASGRATGQRTTLKDPNPPVGQAFYKIVVEK